MRISFTSSRLFTEVRASSFLAAPLASAQLAQAATGFVDTIMIGLLGSQALAAGSLGAVTFNSLLIICTNVVAAVSPLVAEAYGARRPQKAGQVANHGLWIALFLSIPLTILVWHAAPLLRLLGQQPNIVAVTEEYLRAIAWGFLPALGFVALKSFVSAVSRPRPVMIIMIGSVVLNGLMNYLLIFGKLGLPALGLAGAGWASIIAYWIMFLALSIYILSQRSLNSYRVFHNLLYTSRSQLAEIIAIGWPIGVLAAFETGMFTVTTILAGHLGTTTLAAHQIALQTATITFMVPLGVSQATTIRVGQFMGRRDPSGAQLAGYVGIVLGTLFMGAMAMMMWLMPERIVSVYLDLNQPDNQPVVAIASALLSVAAIFQIFDGIQVIATGALRGLKDTRVPMVMGTISYWVIGFSSSFILGMLIGLGGIGLWSGLALGLAVAATILTWRFHRLLSPLASVQGC